MIRRARQLLSKVVKPVWLMVQTFHKDLWWHSQKTVEEGGTICRSKAQQPKSGCSCDFSILYVHICAHCETGPCLYDYIGRIYSIRLDQLASGRHSQWETRLRVQSNLKCIENTRLRASLKGKSSSFLGQWGQWTWGHYKCPGKSSDANLRPSSSNSRIGTVTKRFYVAVWCNHVERSSSSTESWTMMCKLNCGAKFQANRPRISQTAIIGSHSHHWDCNCYWGEWLATIQCRHSLLPSLPPSFPPFTTKKPAG